MPVTRRILDAGPLALATLAALLGSTLLGCSAHVPSALKASVASPSGTAPKPVGRARIAERHEIGGGEDRRAQEAREALEAAYTMGQASLLAGDEDAAFDSFDHALEAVMTSEVDLDAHPELRERTDDVMASIHDLVASAASAETPTTVDRPFTDGASDAIDPTKIAEGTYANLEIPMVAHPAVDSLIRFYTGRGKGHFEVGLQRYGKYAPTVARILKEEGVPAELAWLAMVESNYNTQAYSRARARGLWQFIPGTGRNYGLKQDFWVDERSDFEKETHAAARYLRDLHGMFGDWHLAIASYNAGEGKIGRAIRSTGKRDFWHIRETRYIRRETKDYVPAFLAVLTIVQDPAKYGVAFKPSTPLTWETTTVTAATDLSVIAQCAGSTLEAICDLNPEIRRGTTPGTGEKYTLRIPVGAGATFAERYAALPPEQLLTWKRHVVGSGETLSTISRAYGSSVGSIMAANNLKSAGVAVGSRLVIPQGAASEAVPASVLASRAPNFDGDGDASGAVRRTHRVRPGETLSKIAARYGTSTSRLADWNGLRNSNRIHAGQRLIVYSRQGSSASRVASSGGRSGGSGRVHVVRSGDTLSGIARSYGLSLTALRSMNSLGSASVIRPGQKVHVSGRASSSSSASRSASSTARTAAARTHTVRGGETLSAIARQYKCSIDNLCAWNDIRAAANIHPGDRLKIK